jgi:hypothetical protein
MITKHDFAWKKQVDWAKNVEIVFAYYDSKHGLLYGTSKQNKAHTVIDELCAPHAVYQGMTQSKLMRCEELSTDAILTILSNVTMAIQGEGKVFAPDEGGWYTTKVNPHTYYVCPAFATAWNVARGFL